MPVDIVASVRLACFFTHERLFLQGTVLAMPAKMWPWHRRPYCYTADGLAQMHRCAGRRDRCLESIGISGVITPVTSSVPLTHPRMRRSRSAGPFNFHLSGHAYRAILEWRME